MGGRKQSGLSSVERLAQDRSWEIARQSVDAEKCRRSAHFFIFDGYLRTKDEHDVTIAAKPFPDLLYLRSLLDCLLVSGKFISVAEARYARESGHTDKFLGVIREAGVLAVEKSRQMLVTWLFCAYACWRARYFSNQLILIQSKREDDAANLVFCKEKCVARISFMEANLPRFLQILDWNNCAVFSHLYYPNGSHIWGIPEGGDIIRSNTPSMIISDEAAFQPEFGASYTAALPAIKGGGQWVGVSSANPGEYAELVEAEIS